ncbi:MAG: translocation/assembly module TamB domain-containing protein [Armatimonadetes bacterium]|nr:translocation/assembly module TamB domain-containing protein [Armatimonadota bacterium]
MLRPYQKHIIALIKYVPLIVILIASGLFVMRQINRALDRANLILIAELSQRLNREISVRRTTIRPFGVVVMEGVEIAAEKKLSGGRMLSVPRVVVYYNLRDLVLGGKSAQSVSRVVLEKPALNLIRRPDGRFNVQDLLMPTKKPKGPPFKGIVEVSDARVAFTDYRSGLSKLPAVTTCDSLYGLVDAVNVPVYKFSGSGRGTNGKFDNVSVVGTYNASARVLNVDVNGNGADAKYWAVYFDVSKIVKVLGGKLNIAIGVQYKRVGEKSQTSLAGAFKISNGAVQLSMFKAPVTQVTGSASIINRRILLSLVGTLAGSRVKVSGSINDFVNPKLNLIARSASADFARVMNVLKIPDAVRQLRPIGRGPAQVTITGTANDPVIDAIGTIPAVSIRGYRPESVEVSAAYRPGGIEFRSVKFKMLGGDFSGRGTLSLLGAPRIAFEGRADRVKMSSLPLPTNVSISGTGSASFVVTGPLVRPDFTANVTAAGVSVGELRFSKAAARVEYIDGNLQITGLQAVGGPGGSLSVSGQLSAKSLNVAVTAEATDIGKLARLFGLEGLSGMGYFKGSITGTPARPRISGAVEVFEANYSGYVVNYARMAFSGDARGIRISQAVVRVFPAEIKFSGQVGRLDADRIPFQIDGQMDRLTVSKLMELIGRRVNVTGTITGAISASGIYSKKAGRGESPFVDVNGEADLRLEHGAILDMPVNDASAKVTFADNRLSIAEAQLSSQGAKLTASGSVDVLTKAIDLRIGLSGLDLARLKDRVEDFAAIGGILRASVTLTGALPDVNADVNATVDNLAVSNRKFDQAEIKASYAENIVKSFVIALKRGEQSLLAQGKDYDPETNKIASLSGQMENVKVSDLWGLVLDSPYMQSTNAAKFRETLRGLPKIQGGILNGSFDISGSLARPSGRLDIKAADIMLDIQKVNSISVSATAIDGEVRFEKPLIVVSGDTTLTAEGGFNIPRRDVNLNVAANIDLATLKPWLGAMTPGGVLGGDFIVSGNLSDPKVAGSFDVERLSYGGITFGSLRALPIEISSGQIKFSQIILSSNGHQAVVSGYLPWSWSDFSVPRTQQMQITVSMNRQNLSLINDYVGGSLDTAKTAGDIEAQLVMAGTIAKPELSGSFKVINGTFALRNFTNDFTNINVDLAFAGDRIAVNQLTAASSLGGSIFVKSGGSILVSDLVNSKVDLALAANALIVGEKNALGLKEDIITRIDGGLSVTGNLASPLIADAQVGAILGGISISRSRFAFVAPQGLRARKARIYAIDPRFDISLRVGGDVWVLPPSMTIRVFGLGSLTGTLSSPRFALSLQVAEGNIRLAASRLNVATGGKVDILYAPPADLDLRVNFTASTNITAANQFGNRQRYKVSMAVSGPIDNLHIDLVSSPGGLSREQILSTLGRVEGIFGGGVPLERELGNVLAAVGSSTLFAPIEMFFTEKFGFEQFTLEYSPYRPLALYISRRLAGDIYLSYYGRLTSAFANVSDISYELTLSYRFRENYLFSFGINDQQTSTVQTQYTFLF